MIQLTLQFNPSTLKLSYNTTEKKIRMGTFCLNCDPVCPKGYEPSGTVCGNPIPSYLCATIYGMRRCSDDSIIPTQSVCLAFECNYGGCIGWSATIEIDEITVNVLYRTGVGCAYDTDAFIYDDSSLWFQKLGASDVCVSATSNLGVGDCDSLKDVYECDATYLQRTVVAYGGIMSICNPNNGETW